jgi:AraC-like DNA-binding protein
LSRALCALHARPEHRWTVDALARHVGLSRSALVARFHRLLALAPMRYLLLWRLQLAAHRLQSTSDNLATIAEEIGYGSEVAFSHAFKRFTGVSPAAWRRARQGGRAVAGAQQPAAATDDVRQAIAHDRG